jgi:hypothetical protein
MPWPPNSARGRARAGITDDAEVGPDRSRRLATSLEFFEHHFAKVGHRSIGHLLMTQPYLFIQTTDTQHAKASAAMRLRSSRLVESDRNNGRPKRLGCCGVCVHGTCRPFFSPFLDFCQELMLRCGDWSAAVPRGPPPKHKWRVHMLHNLRGRTMAVPLRIFEQFTELMVGQALPDHRHRGRRQMPTGSSRRHVQAGEIVILMTGAASDSTCTLPVWSTTDLHCVLMTIISLSRKISR